MESRLGEGVWWSSTVAEQALCLPSWLTLKLLGLDQKLGRWADAIMGYLSNTAGEEGLSGVKKVVYSHILTTSHTSISACPQVSYRAGLQTVRW